MNFFNNKLKFKFTFTETELFEMSIKIIHSKYPVNINDSDLHIFKKVVEYKIKITQIKKLKNAFVTNNGLVLQNGILNKKCALNLISKHDHTFYFKYWKKTFEQYLVCKFGKSLPSIKLNDNSKYLIIHSNWLNYSFWITEYLQRLIRVEIELGLANLTLIYPEEWDSIPYIKDSLNAFKIKLKRIPAGHHLFVKNLVFPEVREVTSFFNPDHIKLTSDRLISEAYKRTKINNISAKIYLTRGLNVKRAISNEIELQEFFISKGYEVVSFEKLSIWDQIVYVNNVEILFTIHGAGFANVMFMKQESYAVEFLEKDFAYYANPFPHLKLANAVNVNYAYLLCSSEKTKNIAYQPLKSTNVKDRIEHVDRNINVNLEDLNLLVSKIELEQAEKRKNG